MKARILQILFGIAIFFCSTPFGMANEVIQKEVRAEFFCGGEEVKAAGDEFAGGVDLENESGRQVKAVFNDAGLVQFADCEADGESGVDSDEEVRRGEKRASSDRFFITKCRVLCFLSAGMMSKGVSKHPESQDAQQERTAAVRFLEISALAC